MKNDEYVERLEALYAAALKAGALQLAFEMLMEIKSATDPIVAKESYKT